MEKIVQNFKEECIRRIEESAAKINACHFKLAPHQIWHKPNAVSNSIANLILHLCGNMTQYIVATLHHQPDLRERSKEFYSRPDISSETLLSNFNTIITRVINIINKLSVNDLDASYEVQCYKESGIGILIHVTEHLSYHTGQIVYLTKMITANNMNFYDDAALEKKSIVP
jgi:uncharacterized damage-inducible protein DinB